MTAAHDVVVIGGGITGAAAAVSLLDRGLRVALVDQGVCGRNGATSRSGGIVRVYDPDPAIARLAHHSIVRQRGTLVGRMFEAALRKVGVAFLHDGGAEAALRTAMQAPLYRDVRHEFVSGTDVWEATGLPGKLTGRCAVLETDAGIGDVAGLMQALRRHVERHGTLLEGTAVAGLLPSRDGVTVRLGAAALDAKVAVLATGAWTNRILPQYALTARTIPFVRFTTMASPRLPIIDAVAGAYILPIEPRVVQMGSQVRNASLDVDGLDLTQGDHAADALARARSILGTEPDFQPLAAAVAFDAYTDDGRPLVGFADDERRLYLATGFCGIGYKLAPGVAHLAAAAIAERLGSGKPDPEHAELAAPFAPSRATSLAVPASL